MIGTQENAEVIASLEIVENEWDDWAGEIPNGFEYLGSGSYRHAFLGPDGVVYKRDTLFAEDEQSGSNLAEWETYQSAPALPARVRFARTHLWHVCGSHIIAMEYVQPSGPDVLTGEIVALLRSVGIFDLYGNNAHCRDGEVILTDYTH